MPPKQPPKPAVINPIFNDLTSKLWWEYKKYDVSERELIDNFLNIYGKDIQALMTPKLFENMQIICKLIGNK